MRRGRQDIGGPINYTQTSTGTQQIRVQWAPLGLRQCHQKLALSHPHVTARCLCVPSLPLLCVVQLVPESTRGSKVPSTALWLWLVLLIALQPLFHLALLLHMQRTSQLGSLSARFWDGLGVRQKPTASRLLPLDQGK